MWSPRSIESRRRVSGRALHPTKSPRAGAEAPPACVGCRAARPASRSPLLKANPGNSGRPPTTPRREWRPRSSPSSAYGARRPAGTRQVDPGGRTLLPALDSLRSRTLPGPWRASPSGPEPAACAPELPAPGSHSPLSAGTANGWKRQCPKATFLGEGSPPRGSRITLPAEGRRQLKGEQTGKSCIQLLTSPQPPNTL